MGMLSQYAGLPRQIYVLCVVRIITAMGSFIFSFSSLLMTSVLGMSEVAAGYMMIVFAMGSMTGAFVCGRLADLFGRKRVLLATMSVEITILIIGGFVVYTKAVLVCMAVVSMCFSGVVPTIGAMITDNTDATNRKEGFSLMFLCINIGFAAGQVVAGKLFYNYTRWVFWGQGIAFILSFMVALFFVRDNYAKDMNDAKAAAERARAQAEAEENGLGAEQGNKREFLRLVIADKVLVLFVLSLVLTTFCYSQISYLMPLHFTSCISLETSAEWVSNVWMLNGIFCVVLAPVMLRVTRKNSQLKNAVMASVIYMIGLGSFSLISGSGTLWIAALMTPLWTSGETLISTGTGVFIGSRAPANYRAAYQSLYEIANAIGRCIGPVSMGYFITAFPHRAGWLVVIAAAGLSAVVLLTAIRIDKKQGGKI